MGKSKEKPVEAYPNCCCMPRCACGFVDLDNSASALECFRSGWRVLQDLEYL